jgi:PAS domain-containing protein
MTDVLSDRLSRAAAEIFFVSPADADSPDDHFRKILDVLPAAVYVTDALGRITYFNKQRQRYGAIVLP